MTVALSYGLSAKTFLPMFVALDFVAIEGKIINIMQSFLANAICAFGDCNNWHIYD